MKRFHVHLAVNDIKSSIEFYSTLFGAVPAVEKPDYAKWMLEDPRVNFAISARGHQPGINHLGLQVESAEELEVLGQRLQRLQRKPVKQEGAACCYAKSDKYWVVDPQGLAWEQFHTLAGVPLFGDDRGNDPRKDEACCIPLFDDANSGTEASKGACCVPTQAASGGSCCS